MIDKTNAAEMLNRLLMVLCLNKLSKESEESLKEVIIALDDTAFGRPREEVLKKIAEQQEFFSIAERVRRGELVFENGVFKEVKPAASQ